GRAGRLRHRRAGRAGLRGRGRSRHVRCEGGTQMTRVLWINPLGTDVFDEPIRDELERVKRPDTEVEVRSLGRGPHHLEYACYEAAAVPDLLAMLVQAEREGFEAAVIGCFYDTGLRPAREL